MRHALDADDWTQDRHENDGILGAAAQLLMDRGDVKAAALLIDVERVEFGWGQAEGFHDPVPLYARLFVEPWQVGRFDSDVRQQVVWALSIADSTRDEDVDYVVVSPGQAPPDWREKLQEQLASGPRNQATVGRSQGKVYRADGMAFRTPEEVRVYQAFKQEQERLPRDDTFALIPNCAMRVPNHTWEPDIVVLYRGRSAAIEVDGASHRGKYLSDKSRDEVLTDSGLMFVKRIDATDTTSDDELSAFVRRVLDKLART